MVLSQGKMREEREREGWRISSKKSLLEFTSPKKFYAFLHKLHIALVQPTEVEVLLCMEVLLHCGYNQVIATSAFFVLFM